MKREYEAENNNNNNKDLVDKDLVVRGSMFSKIDHQTTQQQQFHHHLPRQECSDDTHSAGDSIEVSRRPRGRPPGSKNKPKPPVIITRPSEPSSVMSPYVLELSPGSDLIDSLTRFCRARNTSLCVLTGSGTVANVTLRQPTTAPAPAATVTFHGRFDILSISATIYSSCSTTTSPFAISLAGPQGQIIGGSVVGQLLAAGTVYIIAASFNSPLCHRLPEGDDDRVDVSQSPPETAVPGVREAAAGSSSGGMSMTVYSGGNCQLQQQQQQQQQQPSDVIWAPTPRQAPHPPPPPPPY